MQHQIWTAETGSRLNPTPHGYLQAPYGTSSVVSSLDLDTWKEKWREENGELNERIITWFTYWLYFEFDFQCKANALSCKFLSIKWEPGSISQPVPLLLWLPVLFSVTGSWSVNPYFEAWFEHYWLTHFVKTVWVYNLLKLLQKLKTMTQLAASIHFYFVSSFFPSIPFFIHDLSHNHYNNLQSNNNMNIQIQDLNNLNIYP